MATIPLKILVMMPCLHQCVSGGYLVAVDITDYTTDVPIVVTSIGGDQPIDLGSLKALSVHGVGQRGILDRAEPMMIIAAVPSIGQFALTRRSYTEAGNVSLIIVLICTGHQCGFGVAGLDEDLDFRILHVTANSTHAVPVEGMLATVGEMRILITVNAFVPMVGRIPIPRRSGSDGMTNRFGIGMYLGKMLVPIRVFHTDPFAAIAAGIVGKVLTANQAETTLITKTCALRAVLLTVGTDVRAVLAGAAVLTNQNAIGTQIAVFTECLGTFQTTFPAPLAQGYILDVTFTAGAMETCGDGTIQAEILVGIDLGTVAANTTFCTELSAGFTVALRAIRAVHTIVDGALDTKDLSCLLTTVQTGRTTVVTLAAFLAPSRGLEITLVTVGAMMAIIDGTFLANHRTGFAGATLVKLHAIGTQHTLLAPALRVKIALSATGAVGFIASGTVFAKLGSMDFGALLVIACTVATQTALSAKMFHTAIACITAGAVGALIRGTLKAKALSVVATTRSVYIDTVFA